MTNIKLFHNDMKTFLIIVCKKEQDMFDFSSCSVENANSSDYNIQLFN